MGLTIHRRISTQARVITTLVALFALVAQPMYGLVASKVANAASNTTISELKVSNDGFYCFNDSTDAATGTIAGQCEIVANPDDSSKSVVKLTTDTGKMAIATNKYESMPLLNARGSYTTAQVGNTNQSIYMNVNVNFNANGLTSTNGLNDNPSGWQGRVYQVPTNMSKDGAWVTVDPSDPNALWTWSGFSANGDKWPNGDTQSTLTSTQMLTKYPNMAVASGSLGQILWRASTGPAPFTGYISNISFTTNTGIDNHDFKAAPQPVKNLDTNEGFDTIQGAINDPETNADDIISVAAGTYNENVNVTKSVVIKGAQADVDASKRTVDGAGESIVNGGTGASFNIAANGVTINGFEITQNGGGANAIDTSSKANYTGITISNNIITRTGTGFAMNLYGGQNFTVEKNYLTNIAGQGIVLRNGNKITPAATNQKIVDNTIDNLRGMNNGAIVAYGQSGLEIARNKITSTFQGMSIGADGGYYERDINIHDNKITIDLDGTQPNVQLYGIAVGGNSDRVAVKNNTIKQTGVSPSTDRSYALIRVSYNNVSTLAANPTGLVITENNLESSTNDKYIVVGNNVTNKINATSNWWGTQTDPITKVSPTTIVTTSPWLCQPYEVSTSITSVNGSCDVTPAVPTVTFKDANGADRVNGDYVNTASNAFTFTLSADNATSYKLKYWNDIAGDAFQGKSKAWTPANQTTFDGHMTAGVYKDAFTRGEGVHYFAFSACNAAGACSEDQEFTVTYDKTKPAAPKSLAVRTTDTNAYIPTNSATNKKNVTASWVNDANEPVSYIYKFWKDSGSNWTVDNKWEKPMTSTSYPGTYNEGEGVNNICIVAVDMAGNQSACSVTYSVTYDTTDPTANISTNPDIASGDTVKSPLVLTGNSNENVKHWIDVTAPNGTSYTWGTTGELTKSAELNLLNAKDKNGVLIPTLNGQLADGTYTVRYVATDRAGNRSDHLNTPQFTSMLFKFTVDNAAPSAPEITTKKGTISGQQIVTIISDETVTNVTITDQSGADVTPVQNSDGTYTIDTSGMRKGAKVTVHAQAKDDVGNVSDVATSTFTVDNATVVSTGLTQDSLAIDADGNYTLSGVSNTADAAITVYQNGIQVSPANMTTKANGSWTLHLGELIAERTYRFTVGVTDNLGYSSIQTQSYTTAPLKKSEALKLIDDNFNPRSPSIFANTVSAASFVADPAEVLGTQDTKGVDAGILGASKDVAAIAPSAQGWKFFGITWYWLLLAIAAVAAIWWWIAAARRRNQEA